MSFYTILVIGGFIDFTSPILKFIDLQHFNPRTGL